jgi:hypothetical protein
MSRSWGPLSGRQLTTVIIAVCTTVVVAPGAVWAVDTFSNVAVEDPVTGTKASVDATRHLVVGDGSGALTVDGTAVQTLPSTAKSPFRGEAFLSDFNSVGFQADTDPSNATVALTHLVVSTRADSAAPWEAFLYLSEGATRAECVSNMFNFGFWARIGARAAAPGTSSVDDLTTPIMLKPLHTGKSWCIVTGASPKSGASGAGGVVLDYSGFLLSGSFTPAPTKLAAPSGKGSAANP